MKKVIVFSSVFLIFVVLVSCYEFFIVGAPFFEVIPAYIMWSAVGFISLFWLFRVCEATRPQ
ncbi:MAG: hypothetical protein ACRCY4_01900 [Brevinema sp.]